MYFVKNFLYQLCRVFGPLICGSDGKTYNSECEIKMAQCKAQKLITVASKGPCVGESASTEHSVIQ